MPVTKQDVEKIAELARLELTPDEIESFSSQLSSILGYIDQLNEIDTTTEQPMSHSGVGANVAEYAQRDDKVQPSLGSSLATENAPDTQAGYFKVPKVIGG